MYLPPAWESMKPLKKCILSKERCHEMICLNSYPLYNFLILPGSPTVVICLFFVFFYFSSLFLSLFFCFVCLIDFLFFIFIFPFVYFCWDPVLCICIIAPLCILCWMMNPPIFFFQLDVHCSYCFSLTLHYLPLPTSIKYKQIFV